MTIRGTTFRTTLGNWTCPLCDEDLTFTFTAGERPTYHHPGSADLVEDIVPGCDCVNHACVDEGKYYASIEEDILANWNPE